MPNKSPNKIIFAGTLLIIIALLGFKFFTKKDKPPDNTEEKSTVIEFLDNDQKEQEENSSTSTSSAPKENSEISIVAVGDIIMSRTVGIKITESGDNALPFRKIADILLAGDITFGNVEAPFLDQGELIREGMTFKAEPKFIEGLTLSGFDVVSLANNHSKNFGAEGLTYTFNHLASNDIKYCGAGNNSQEAHQPAILESKGIKFAFLAHTYSDGLDFKTHLDKDKPDIAFWDLPQAVEDIKKAKEQADVVISYMHAGQEYTAKPIPEQVEFAHAVIDAGADLVIGSHSHWVQTTEKYKDKYIIYSMGNFVFDQEWSQETKEGVIVKLKFDNRKFNLAEFIPVIIENYNQPRLANEKEIEKILKQMKLKGEIVNL